MNFVEFVYQPNHVIINYKITERFVLSMNHVIWKLQKTFVSYAVDFTVEYNMILLDLQTFRQWLKFWGNVFFEEKVSQNIFELLPVSDVFHMMNDLGKKFSFQRLG